MNQIHCCRSEGWEEIGTTEEKPPLILENCLSYDEMKLSSMVYVSGYTECINGGSRFKYIHKKIVFGSRLMPRPLVIKLVLYIL